MCLNTDFGSSFSGVLTDEQGRVQALWGSFSTQVLTRYSFACLHGSIWTFFIEPKIRKNTNVNWVIKIILRNIEIKRVL